MSSAADTTERSPALETEPTTELGRDRRSRLRPAIAAIAILTVVSIVVGWYLHSETVEDTDDAQVDGHIVPIASRIEGTIQAVHVDDNQSVKVGDVLVELDPQDYKVAADQAKAQYEQATAQLGAANPNLPMTRISNQSDLVSGTAQVAAAQAALDSARNDLAVAEAHFKESQAVDERSQADFQRYKTLFQKNEVARAEYDQRRSTANAQAQTVAANQAAVRSAEKTVDQRVAQLEDLQSKLNQTQRSAALRLVIREADIKTQRASADAARAAYEKASLNLKYGKIVAPVAGVVTQRSAEIDSRVSQGQPLMMIVQIDDLWVTANFKETQLARMHPGQAAKIYVDALSREFDGTVESMPAITGSRSSVLPPENATGNFVKVIQRMPVRLRFKPNQKDLEKLRPGMSVEPKVYLRSNG
jgi:membrane fusion protein, multidrug efflux system